MGLDPMFAMEHVVVINGKATIDGQGMLALIYSRSEIKVTFGEQPGVVTMERQGQSPVTKTWTIERARKAGLLEKDPWKKYPEQMLTWRAVSECARLVAPDVIGGLYLHEEMGATVDEEGNIVQVEPARIAAAKNVTPPEKETPAAAPAAQELAADGQITPQEWEETKAYAKKLGIDPTRVVEDVKGIFDGRQPYQLIRSELAFLRKHLEVEAEKALRRESEKNQEPDTSPPTPEEGAATGDFAPNPIA
jgi:hypothetical protein